MNKITASALAAIIATTFTGCIADGGYASGYSGGYAPSYGHSRVYAEDYGSSSYGYGGSRYATEVIYIDGHACRHDQDRDRYYYTSGRDRIYISPEQYGRNREAIDRYKLQQRQQEAEARYNYSKNKQKLETAKLQNEWKERQARYGYEQEKKNYQVQQKIASNQAVLDKAKYKAGVENQRKQWEYQQKAAELKQREAVAKYKYEHGVRSDDDDKKKKKKD